MRLLSALRSGFPDSGNVTFVTPAIFDFELLIALFIISWRSSFDIRLISPVNIFARFCPVSCPVLILGDLGPGVLSLGDCCLSGGGTIFGADIGVIFGVETVFCAGADTTLGVGTGIVFGAGTIFGAGTGTGILFGVGTIDVLDNPSVALFLAICTVTFPLGCGTTARSFDCDRLISRVDGAAVGVDRKSG